MENDEIDAIDPTGWRLSGGTSTFMTAELHSFGRMKTQKDWLVKGSSLQHMTTAAAKQSNNRRVAELERRVDSLSHLVQQSKSENTALRHSNQQLSLAMDKLTMSLDLDQQLADQSAVRLPPGSFDTQVHASGRRLYPTPTHPPLPAASEIAPRSRPCAPAARRSFGAQSLAGQFANELLTSRLLQREQARRRAEKAELERKHGEELKLLRSQMANLEAQLRRAEHGQQAAAAEAAKAREEAAAEAAKAREEVAEAKRNRGPPPPSYKEIVNQVKERNIGRKPSVVGVKR